MSIERLRVRNFQRHRRLDVRLDPGVTTVVGPTDRGKSALLRALRWVLQNRPDGGAFVRAGAAEARVEVVAEGRRLVRRRGPRGGGTYALDGRRFSAVGRGVPEEVAAVAAVGDLNFQGQLDPPFWLTESPGEVSRRLNQVVDLALVDQSLARVGATVRRAEAALDAADARALATVAEASRLEAAAGATRSLRRAESAEARRRAAALEADALRGALASARRAGEVAGRLRGLPDALRALRSVERAAERAERAQGARKRVLEAAEAACGRRREVRELRARAKDAEAKLEEATRGRCPLCLRSGPR